MCNRPKYETILNLMAEKKVVNQICKHFNFDAVKLPINSRADYLLSQDAIAKAIIEIKIRNNDRSKYPTYMISKGKYDALLSWLDMGFESAIFVKWKDDLAYVKLPIQHEVAKGGRRDRGDPLDIKEVVLINIDKFKSIEKETKSNDTVEP